VTHDRRYWIAYQPGQVYRLKSDARLVVHWPGTRDQELQLWSAGVIRRNQGDRQYLAEFSPVEMVPAGSTIRVDSLWHNYAVNFPPIVQGETRIVRPFGTLTSPAGTWEKVLLPDDRTRKWRRAPDSVFVFPADTELLEEVRASDATSLSATPP
jgi:hypothetical protein